MTFDGFEGDIELPKLGNGEFFGHFDELDGKHFLDVSGKVYVRRSRTELVNRISCCEYECNVKNKRSS